MIPILVDRLYCLLGEDFSNGRDNVEMAELLLRGGARILQYREKKRCQLYQYRQCLRIRELTRQYEAKFIINDNVAIAMAVEADGVHVGQDDLPVTAIRKLVGGNIAIGLSTHNPEQARRAAVDGADYIGVGPIYATATKEDVCAPVGIDYLEYAAQNAGIPFVAIGGIKRHNLSEVLHAGASCVAMVTEILGADDIAARVRELKQLLDA